LWRIESATPLRDEAGGSAGRGRGAGAAAAAAAATAVAGAGLPDCNMLPNGSEYIHNPHSRAQKYDKMTILTAISRFTGLSQ